MTQKILIAEDHGVLRAGLRALLAGEPGFEVVGEAVNGEQALQLANTLHPNIILMDLSMPGIGGIEVTRQLTERKPEIRVLILSIHEDEELLHEALSAGASGYIIKRAAETELITALQAVARGELYVHPALMRFLLRKPAPPSKALVAQDTLTSRELDVLRLIVQGYTNRQIASELHIGVRTVESHRSNLMEKLDLHSRVELVRYAVEHGLYKPGG